MPPATPEGQLKVEAHKLSRWQNTEALLIYELKVSEDPLRD